MKEKRTHDEDKAMSNFSYNFILLHETLENIINFCREKIVDKLNYYVVI